MVQSGSPRANKFARWTLTRPENLLPIAVHGDGYAPPQLHNEGCLFNQAMLRLWLVLSSVIGRMTVIVVPLPIRLST